MLKLSERKIQFSEDYIDHTLYILESEAKFSSCLWKTFFTKPIIAHLSLNVSQWRQKVLNIFILIVYSNMYAIYWTQSRECQYFSEFSDKYP